ncbi:hypothetical protein BJ912DRAFT_986431 [Pholiota molesta]|nr:hypothetical protein BJ912DRAFT_986431 [Pholiota molesta]
MSSEKEALSTIPQSPLPDAPPAYDTLTATATLLESLAHTMHGPAPASQPIMLPADPPPPPSPRPRPQTHAERLLHREPQDQEELVPVRRLRVGRGGPGSGVRAHAGRGAHDRPRLVRDLVRDHSAGSPAARGVLGSCADVCASHGIALSEILTDPFIESHSPLYWAIVKRARPETDTSDPEDDDAGQEGDLVGAMLARCTPLTPATVAELRLACLATGDQAMFQRLRPHVASPSGTDQLLLGGGLPPDDVAVELLAGAEGAFAVRVAVPQYHKRMMIAKEIGLEFVARNRIWRFALLIIPDGAWYGPPPGSWCIALSLRAPSPPTWLDATLSLSPPPGEDTTPQATPDGLQVRSKQMLEAPRNGVAATQVLVPLDGAPAFAGLQYSGGSADETLRLRLEARLRKPSDF